MDHIAAVLFYKVASLFVGTIIVFFGYNLYCRGIFNSGSDAEFETTFGNNTILLKKAAPGTFFALFGSIVIGATIWKGFSVEVGHRLGDTQNVFEPIINVREYDVNGRPLVVTDPLNPLDAYRSTSRSHIQGHVSGSDDEVIDVVENPDSSTPYYNSAVHGQTVVSEQEIVQVVQPLEPLPPIMTMEIITMEAQGQLADPDEEEYYQYEGESPIHKKNARGEDDLPGSSYP